MSENLKVDESADAELQRLFRQEVKTLIEYFERGGDAEQFTPAGESLNSTNNEYVAPAIVIARLFDGYYVGSSRKVMRYAQSIIEYSVTAKTANIKLKREATTTD